MKQKHKIHTDKHKQIYRLAVVLRARQWTQCSQSAICDGWYTGH